VVLRTGRAFLTADLCASPDVPRSDFRMKVVAKFREELSPEWEWLDYLADFRLARTCGLRKPMDMSA